MVKRLTAIGNSYGIIIDRSILELLHITPETDIELSTDGERLILAPVGKTPLRKRRKRRPPQPPGPPTRPAPPGDPDPWPEDPEPRYGFPKKQPW